MNALSHALDRLFTSHRSIRKFSQKKIDKQVIEAIIQKSIDGTSTFGNLLGYSIIASYDQEKKDALFYAHDKQSLIKHSGLILTFCADLARTQQWQKLRNAEACFDNLYGLFIGTVDAALIAQSVALACEAEGLGICYLGSTLSGCQDIVEILALPQQVFPVTSIAIGYPDEAPQARKRLPLKVVFHEENYQQFNDDTLIGIFKEKEKSCWSRYQSDPELKQKMEEHNILNLAQYYASELKYGSQHNKRISANLFDYLVKNGFLENL